MAAANKNITYNIYDTTKTLFRFSFGFIVSILCSHLIFRLTNDFMQSAFNEERESYFLRSKYTL